jgi:hypothetical protein
MAMVGLVRNGEGTERGSGLRLLKRDPSFFAILVAMLLIALDDLQNRMWYLAAAAGLVVVGCVIALVRRIFPSSRRFLDPLMNRQSGTK